MTPVDYLESSTLKVRVSFDGRQSRLICFAVAFNLLSSRAYLTYGHPLQLKNETLSEQIYDAFISLN